MLLKLTNNETHTAYDGLEAVEAAATWKPEVILLDIGLPKLNGYEACCRIRNEPWGKNMVLVALTGWGQEEDRQRSRDAGFNGHLVKPVDLAALTKLLDDRAPANRPLHADHFTQDATKVSRINTYRFLTPFSSLCP